jgi:uncharacterized RDD family membrane protein YckC
MNDEFNQGSTNPFGAPEPIGRHHLRVGFGPRLAAYVIDMLGSALFGALLAFLFLQLDVTTLPGMDEDLQTITDIYALFGLGGEFTDFMMKFIPALTLGSIIAAITYSLIEGMTGASPGKLVMSIRIAHPDGRAGSITLFLRRWAIKNISSILQFIALVPTLAFVDVIGGLLGLVIFVGCFFVLGQDRLALHDRIAQTAVYHRDDI